MAEPTLSYRVEGEGQPLLLVHGFVISYNIWQNLLPLLRPHFKLVMIQLPGSGGSPLPPEGEDYVSAALVGIEQVRQALGFETWSVLGYSSGSRIAEAYVQKYAGHVSRAIFLCPLQVAAHRLDGLNRVLLFDRSRPVVGDWVLRGRRIKFLISWLGFNLKPDPLANDWYAEIGAAPMRALKETIRAVAPVAGRPFSVPVPRLMIWADRDAVSRPPRRPGPHDRLIHGQHAAPVEAADQVAGAILDWNEWAVEQEHG
jgi:pimeloyl-ACP methyl ester carboxylesterase